MSSVTNAELSVPVSIAGLFAPIRWTGPSGASSGSITLMAPEGTVMPTVAEPVGHAMLPA
ncbi:MULTISPECIES: hypothetical protein [unclassified Streptomyces]|uniref:hypothetical protein n=1 Tax=unclassified Streptomyces TaxID=2593676 RepID=UPI00336AD665